MSGTPTTHFIDESFQSQHAAKCDLLISLSGSSFSYAVVDQIQDQLKILHSVQSDNPFDVLKMAISGDHVFNFNFRKIKVSAETDQFTFIPVEAYSEEFMPAYAKFISSQSDAEHHAIQIRSAGIRNITSIKTELTAALGQKFSGASLFSQAEPFIESAIKLYFKPIVPQAFIHLNSSTFEFLITEGKKVKFYNLFQNTATDEFNYFLLFAISQLKINTKEIPVILSGEISESDERYQRIQKYFTEINFADSSKLIRIPEVFEQPLHRFFTLLSLNICA